MPDFTEYTCELCRSSRQVIFCRDCAQEVCINCVRIVETPQWSCQNCEEVRDGSVCGTCGSECHVTKNIAENACPTCNSVRLGDPEVLIKNLPSEFFTIISRVQVVNQEILDLHRSFDFMVALVRFCRLAGFLGFPQMEYQLEKCSEALTKINDRSIKQLNQIRKEGLYDLRRLDYFSDIEINHFRNAETVLQATADKIDRLAATIRHWIGEVQQQLENLKPLALFLRQHYDYLVDIDRYMPEGIQGVVAIIQPLAMKVQTSRKTAQGKNYIVFTEEHLVFLPRRALEQPNEIITAIQVPYGQLIEKRCSNSLLKGSQLQIKLSSGKVVISAPPQVLKRLNNYFSLIDSDEPYMVGSPKKIIQIEAEAPDKNEYKRATKRFIGIFREWLFGDPVQRPPREKLELPSMKELLERLNKLEHAYRDINLRASNLQITPDEYQSRSSNIKDDFESIKNSLYKLGGHLGRNMDKSIGGF